MNDRKLLGYVLADKMGDSYSKSDGNPKKFFKAKNPAHRFHMQININVS